jgi:hypothetical protein
MVYWYVVRTHVTNLKGSIVTIFERLGIRNERWERVFSRRKRDPLPHIRFPRTHPFCYFSLYSSPCVNCSPPYFKLNIYKPESLVISARWAKIKHLLKLIETTTLYSLKKGVTPNPTCLIPAPSAHI